jgi:hypothetical protein
MGLWSKVLIILIAWLTAVPVHAEKATIKQMVSVRFVSKLSSATAHEGDSWNATLAQDLSVDGRTYGHTGDNVLGTVLAVHPGAGSESRGALTLRLQSINGTKVEAGTVRRSVMGSITQENPKADAIVNEGDTIGFYVISFG